LAETSGGVAGQSSGKAHASIGGTPLAFTKALQGAAFIDGAPSAAAASSVFSANSNIANAFGAAPTVFGIAELGGAHSTTGAAQQTVTSVVDETVDLTQLSSRRALEVGFYGGAVTGAGFAGATLDIFVDGADALHKVFATAAAATAFFTNHTVDLGSLASGKSADTLTLHTVFSVNSTAANSGFFGDMIVGDQSAPPAPDGTHGFVQAMAGFGAGAGGHVVPSTESGRATPALLAATHG
jgi:hypothetical protein